LRCAAGGGRLRVAYADGDAYLNARAAPHCYAYAALLRRDDPDGALYQGVK